MAGGYAAGMSQLETKAEEEILPVSINPRDSEEIDRIGAPIDPKFQYSIDRNAPNQRLQPVRPPPTSGFAGGPPPPTGIAAAGQPVEEITETTSFSELFPFDPTGQAISNRRTQGGGGGGGGLGSLI